MTTTFLVAVVNIIMAISEDDGDVLGGCRDDPHYRPTI